MVEDINDVEEDANYYIGTLIVSRQGKKYEVVDGQQRLTSLYLLLNCLDYNVQNSLEFSCREKSNYTLRNIQELIHINYSKLDMDRIELSIQNAIRILLHEIQREEFDKEKFCQKLSHVVIYRIEVPENTDLNRYFEIMNTRGEQLEQHDILKATLMSYLIDDKDKSIFSKIWNACSDMTGYVQMHFFSKGNEVRETIFGGYWNDMPPNSWSFYKQQIKSDLLEDVGYTIEEIIDSNFIVDFDDGYLDDDKRVRFESVIEFSYFLLHTLKVYIAMKGIKHEVDDLKIIDEQLDDKKLIESFKRVTTYGVYDNIKLIDNKQDFSKDFIICLLRTRFLFDKYIIKREYVNKNEDGEWSLKSLYVSSHQSQKKMHWITKLLIWLSKNNNENTLDKDLSRFCDVIEDIAKEAVVKQFFNVCRDGVFEMGVNTPHIVFNYLDYLLWKNEPKKYNDFVFEFRNSVEHWYPQNPSEGTFEVWKNGVNQFGNLCLIQRNVNSKFSNMSPEAKKSTFKEMISKGSIKLRIMSELTENKDGMAASLYWKDISCKEHEKKMIDILYSNCCLNEE